MSLPTWLEQQWQQLMENHTQSRLGHALLLSGPIGVGKLQLAEKLRALALCSEGSSPACGCCRSCEVAAAGNHADDHELFLPSDKKSIGVDQVRELIEGLMLSPTYENRKFALVSPAESMTMAAANALLKTLEEPPGSTLIVLVAHQAWRLPATIISRCQLVQCSTPKKEVAVEWLQNEFGEPEWDICLQLASGAPYQAIKYKKQGIEKIFESVIEDVLQLYNSQVDVASVSQRWTGETLPLRLKSLYLVLKMLALKTLQVEGELAHKSSFSSLHNATRQIKLSGLLGYQEQVVQTSARLDSSLNVQLMLESLLSPWVNGFKSSQLEYKYL